MSSYVVLARRYRPQTFDQLIGQEHVTETLKNALKTERHAHAYLFTGPRGVGKTSAARITAKALRCLNRGEDGNPCNECEACLELNKGQSMDVIEIDAASNTGVDNIRELRENVGYMASVGKYRVYIIDEVHMLSTAAFNALLKTLEEPPEHVVFIFATTEIHKVPATIQSRCQRFDFKKIPFKMMKENLLNLCQQEGVEIDEASLSTIAVESEGCLRDAQSLLDQAIALSSGKIEVQKLEEALGFVDRQRFFQLIRHIFTHDQGESLKIVVDLLMRGVDAKLLLNKITFFFRELHYHAFTKEFLLDDTDMQDLCKEAREQLSDDEIIRAFDLCLQQGTRLSSSILSSYTVESLVLKLALQRPATVSASSLMKGAAPSSAIPVAKPRSSGGTMSSRPPSSPARTATPQAESTKVSVEKSSAPAMKLSDSTSSEEIRSNLESYLNRNKPAWMPVMKSFQSAEVSDGKLEIKVNADFAGKRLSSEDGLKILKAAFEAKQVKVHLMKEEGGEPKLSPYAKMKKKESEAVENEAVQSAIKMFGATVSDTKVLED